MAIRRVLSRCTDRRCSSARLLGTTEPCSPSTRELLGDHRVHRLRPKGRRWSQRQFQKLARCRSPASKFSRRGSLNSPPLLPSPQIISLGICSTDGSIHFSFDNHDTPLVYRRSLGDLTTNPEGASWSTSSFSAVLNVLPGLEEIERSTFEVSKNTDV